MPNHVTNRLTIEGPVSRVEALLKQARVQVTEGANTDVREFSFRGFVPPPKSSVYNSGSCGHPHPPSFNGKTPDPYSDCWYPWNVANWGTKWDAYDTRIERDNKTILDHLVNESEEPRITVKVYFDTAWSPPEPVIQKIVEQYADLNIEHACMDEDMMGSGGSVREFVNGEQVSNSGQINDPERGLFQEIAYDLKGFDYDQYVKEQAEEAEQTKGGE